MTAARREDAVGVAGLVPWTPGRGQSYEAALEAEVIALRAVVQELVRNDGLYGGAPCWQEGSLAAQAFERSRTPPPTAPTAAPGPSPGEERHRTMREVYGPNLSAALDTPHTMPVPREMVEALVEQGECRRARQVLGRMRGNGLMDGVEFSSSPGVCPFCDAVRLLSWEEENRG